MSPTRRHFMQFAAAAAALPAGPRLAYAQAYPTKPIHLVVPVPPAGTFDIVARLVANATTPHIGQQFVVENRGGAGTNLGTGLVIHAAPDGYTLLLAGSPGAINATLYHNLDFSFARDIEPVASIERAPLVMVANQAFAARTVAEFISYAKSNPGKINMGSGGIGSTGHVAGELFNMMAGLKMAHVPYRGEAPAITDLLGGQVQVVFSTPGSVMSAVKSGTLHALGVPSAWTSCPTCRRSPKHLPVTKPCRGRASAPRRIRLMPSSISSTAHSTPHSPSPRLKPALPSSVPS